MWHIVEAKAAAKALDKLPPEVKRRYDAWIQIVRLQGPQGLRAIKGFHDEALRGELKGYRSSRLSIKWRVIYAVKADVVTVEVRDVNAHRYKT